MSNFLGPNIICCALAHGTCPIDLTSDVDYSQFLESQPLTYLNGTRAVNGMLPMHAGNDGFRDSVRRILEHNSSLATVTDIGGLSLLHYLASNNDHELVDLLLNQTMTHDAALYKHWLSLLPIHVAAESGAVNVVQVLLRHRSEAVNEALYTAVKYNRTEVVHFLLHDYKWSVPIDMNYTSPEANSSFEATPFRLAIHWGRWEIVDMLIDHDTGVLDVVGADGLTSIQAAIYGNRLELFTNTQLRHHKYRHEGGGRGNEWAWRVDHPVLSATKSGAHTPNQRLQHSF